MKLILQGSSKEIAELLKTALPTDDRQSGKVIVRKLEDYLKNKVNGETNPFQ